MNTDLLLVLFLKVLIRESPWLLFACEFRKRMGSGEPHGLQNRRAAGYPVAGAFDSHTLPPDIDQSVNLAASVTQGQSRLLLLIGANEIFSHPLLDFALGGLGAAANAELTRTVGPTCAFRGWYRRHLNSSSLFAVPFGRFSSTFCHISIPMIPALSWCHSRW